MFKHCQDIFFDLDHTLWDFERNSEITFEIILNKHRIPVSLESFMKVYKPINFDYWKLYGAAKITKEALRYGRLKDSFAVLGVEVPDRLIEALSEDYIVYLRQQKHLFPNAIELLEYLAPKYNLHIITNGFTEVQSGKLKSSKIDTYFNCIIDSEEVGVKKPHPDIFHFALNAANAVASKSLMIGDNIEADILGAKAVGYHAIHFNAHQDPEHPHCPMVDDLIEIKKFL